MAKRRYVNFFQKAMVAPLLDAPILIDFDAAIVQTMLGAIESRKERSFWIDQDNHKRGLQRLNWAQARILMDRSEVLIRTIRNLQGYDFDYPANSDLVPLFPDELSTIAGLNIGLSEVAGAVDESKQAIVDKLQEVIDALQGQGVNSEEVVSLLSSILAAL